MIHDGAVKDSDIYFKKITNLSLPVADPDAIKGELLFHYGNSRYYEIIDKSYRDTIATAFPVAPKKIFLAELIGPLRPHIDNGISCSLNYYLNPNGYITNFWDPIKNAKRLKSKRYDKATDSYSDVELGYKQDDLVLRYSFTAEAGDIYLLNNSKVHSVTHHEITFSPRDIRLFIQCQWNNDINIDELLKIIVPEL